MDERELHHLQQPFREATSGRQAYGAGPYLDIAPSEEGQSYVDFTLAEDVR